MSDPEIKSWPLKIDLTDPKIQYSYKPSSSNFNIAFGLVEGRVLSPNIASFEAIYITSKTVKTAAGTEKDKIQKKLTLVKCDAN